MSISYVFKNKTKKWNDIFIIKYINCKFKQNLAKEVVLDYSKYISSK